MGSKHTQGPWHVNKIDPGFGTVYEYEIWADYWPVKKANLIGVVSSRGYSTEDEANARLIAAAPTVVEERDRLKEINANLLAALWLYVTLDNDHRAGCDLWDEDWAACHGPAMAAIGKAGKEKLFAPLPVLSPEAEAFYKEENNASSDSEILQ